MSTRRGVGGGSFAATKGVLGDSELALLSLISALVAAYSANQRDDECEMHVTRICRRK